MEKNTIKLNGILLLIMLFFNLIYMINDEVFFKAIASLSFVFIGFVNFNYCKNNKTNLNFTKWMLYALICTMVGDILIVPNFYIGVIVFAIGHILYFTSYCQLEKINFNDLKYGIVISLVAVSIIIFAPFVDFGNGAMKSICCIYGIIISFMVGKATSNRIKQNNKTRNIISIGSVLFLISDSMLMLDVFSGISVASYLCLSTYYPAQFLLALSIFTYAIDDLSQENKSYDTEIIRDI